MRYKIIYIDPPWKYGSWGVGSSKSSFNKKYNEKSVPMPYKQMEIEDIKNLDISSLADNNCELYLWVTQKYLPYSFDIISCWGFKYCQTLVWCKKPMGKGQGGVFCPTNEFLILGRKNRYYVV